LMNVKLTDRERKELEADSALAWMTYMGAVQNKGKAMEWRDRLWMTDILADNYPEQVIRKAAQIGMSTAEIFRVLHQSVHHITNTIYILPHYDAVKQFVSSKVDPIMEYNSIPTHGKNSIEEKIIGGGREKSFLFFKGSWTEREAIMIDADYLVFDEKDHCDQGVLEIYESRIKASEYGWMHKFSTPTAPNKRIDRDFQASDQHHWFVKCPSCGDRWYLDWPDSVDYDREIYVCQKCLNEITDNARRAGEWVNKWDKGNRPRGYWVSQLMAPWIPASDLITEEKKVGKQYFTNYCIGKGYAGSDVTISEGLISACLSSERPEKADMCLGVDVGGSAHHWVIGNDRGIYEIGVANYTETDGDKGYNRLAAKMTEYDVKTCVIDGNPRTNESREFAEAFPYRIFLSYFKPQDRQPAPFYYVEDEFNIIADRHRVLSAVIKEFANGKIQLFIEPTDEDYDTFTKQWSALYLKTETMPDGTEKQTWDNGGDPDHFALATAYMRCAVGRYKAWEEVNETSLTEDRQEPKVGALIFGEKEDGYDWYYGADEQER